MATDAQEIRRASYGGSEEADRDLLERLYRLQVLGRTFDRKAISLHRQGRIGTYAPMAGQEAAQVGAATALAEEDWLFPTYRDHAMYLTRGVELEAVLDHLKGRGNYVDRADPDGLRTFPPTIPIATQLPHAVGVGMAADYDGEECAILASFGDGATSEGDFHEGMNFAGVFEAPVVFFCQNNGYAISTPTERQTASPTIACKAEAYGFEGIRVDGNDALAVYRTIDEALSRARAGEGPTLVEAVTYRKGAHTTTDDPTVYRDEDEAEEWPDPVEQTRERLVGEHGWTDEQDEQLREWADEQVEAAVEAVENRDDLEPEAMFEHVYAGSDPRLRTQREQIPENPRWDH